jgi:hypothetical protein
MTTHRFDPISLVLGAIVIAIGIAAGNARLGNLINHRPDALVPLAVLGAGLLTVAVAARRIVHSEPNDGLPEDVTSA